MQQEWTGERLETFVFNESAIEHLHRYAIAKELVKDKVVLDIACGEGYGANLLAKDAKSVIGLDKDATTINKARKKYTAPNLIFSEGLFENIPVADHSLDVIVSFETIEHIADHVIILKEIKRVLKPDGVLIISTPDKKYYSDLAAYNNPFHVHELYKGEFTDLINRHFKHTYLLYQKLLLSSFALSNEESKIKIYEGTYDNIWVKENIEPIYLIVVASDIHLEKPESSIFSGNSLLQTALEQKEHDLKKTLTYRVGNAVLFPFKLLKKILGKKKAISS